MAQSNVRIPKEIKWVELYWENDSSVGMMPRSLMIEGDPLIDADAFFDLDSDEGQWEALKTLAEFKAKIADAFALVEEESPRVKFDFEF